MKLEKVWLLSKIVLNITQHFLNLPAYTIMFLTFIFQIQHRWERSLSICIKGNDPRVRLLYLKCCMCWATTFQTSSNNVGFNNCWIQQCIMMWNLLLSVIQKYFSNEPKNQLALSVTTLSTVWGIVPGLRRSVTFWGETLTSRSPSGSLFWKQTLIIALKCM